MAHFTGGGWTVVLFFLSRMLPPWSCLHLSFHSWPVVGRSARRCCVEIDVRDTGIHRLELTDCQQTESEPVKKEPGQKGKITPWFLNCLLRVWGHNCQLFAWQHFCRIWRCNEPGTRALSPSIITCAVTQCRHRWVITALTVQKWPLYSWRTSFWLTYGLHVSWMVMSVLREINKRWVVILRRSDRLFYRRSLTAGRCAYWNRAPPSRPYFRLSCLLCCKLRKVSSHLSVSVSAGIWKQHQQNRIVLLNDHSLAVTVWHFRNYSSRLSYLLKEPG